MTNTQLKSLAKAVAGINHILIMPHNDPDPDAIASAFALRYLLARKWGITADIAYKGIIGRAENRALARYLDYPLQPFPETDSEQAAAIALVDTQPGARNNPWTPQSNLIAVIDHHPWQEPTATARFVDVRPELGAASTILLEYIRAADLELPDFLATALFYGLKTDTKGLSRAVSPADAAAYFYLQPRIDVEALAEIERAQVPAAYFRKFALTLEATRVYNGMAISFMGRIEYPDMVAEIADLLLRLEQIEWVICMGVYQDTLLLAVRTLSRHGDAGQLTQAVIPAEGAAGGHGAMAGGQIPLNSREAGQIVAEINTHIFRYLNLKEGISGQPLI